MRKAQRKAFILEQIRAEAHVTVTGLSETFALSEVSVRKLLDEMEREGSLRRTWGGAASAQGSLQEPAYQDKIERNQAEKEAIADAAYARIADGDAIYLDSGTTSLRLAQRLAGGERRGVWVCTNALNVAMAFQEVHHIEVVLIGGTFRPRILSCTGGVAREMLGRLCFDKAFLTGSGFSVERGLTTPNIEEAEIKRTVLLGAREIFVMADYSKYGNDALAQIAPVRQMGTLITDWRMQPAVVERFMALGIGVVSAQMRKE